MGWLAGWLVAWCGGYAECMLNGYDAIRYSYSYVRVVLSSPSYYPCRASYDLASDESMNIHHTSLAALLAWLLRSLALVLGRSECDERMMSP